MKIRRNERTRAGAPLDRAKTAAGQKGTEDDDLRRHLLVHAARLSTYPLVREEIRSIIMARDTLTGLAPMDVSAVYKGKGKGKEKDEEKNPATNPDAEVICYCSHRKRHRKRDCRTFEKDKDKKGVNAVEQAPGLTPRATAAPSVTSSRVIMIELDDCNPAVSHMTTRKWWDRSSG